MNRRSVMQALAGSLAALPSAAKQVEGAMQRGFAQGGIPIDKLANAPMEGPRAVAVNTSPLMSRQAAIKLALTNAGNRAELESLLYNQFRFIDAVDYDLATKRSFSPAAKITFQRQRLVARHIEEMTEGSYWQILQDLAERFTNPLRFT